MNLIKKDIHVRVGSVAENSRAMWVVASTEDIDRDGDRIWSTAWHFENFMKNPVIPWAHKYDQPPVAKALTVKVQDALLKLLVQFATREEYAFADTVYRLYKGGYLNAFSVGFNPVIFEWVNRSLNGRKMRGRDYHEVELWEVSGCTVPSNPNALVMARQKGVITQREYDAIDPKEFLKDLAEEAVEARIEKIVSSRIGRLLGGRLF